VETRGRAVGDSPINREAPTRDFGSGSNAISSGSSGASWVQSGSTSIAPGYLCERDRMYPASSSAQRTRSPTTRMYYAVVHIGTAVPGLREGSARSSGGFFGSRPDARHITHGRGQVH
jgi:hypothetical protein